MSKTTRRNVTLSVDKALLDEARDLNLDLSAIAETALHTAVIAARRDRWTPDQTESGVALRSGFAAGGLRLAGWHTLHTDQ